MPEDDAQNQDGAQGGDGAAAGKDGFKPITNQDELNAALKDRLGRERAKYADYNDLKTKAAELDQIKAANQTEAEKTAERIAKLEQELDTTRTTALRSRIQARFKIADEDAALFLTATDEATLVKQAERLTERAADRSKNGNRAPLQGRTPSSSGSDPMREFARGLLGRD